MIVKYTIGTVCFNFKVSPRTILSIKMMYDLMYNLNLNFSVKLIN